MAKNILRKKFADIITSHDNDYKIIDNAVSMIEKYNPRIVGIYITRQNEIDLIPMTLKFNKIIFAAPKILNDEILFTTYYPGAPIEPNEQYTSYFEPVSNQVVIPNLIFIPGIAFDIKGYRLGMGKGHYDKYLAGHKATKIGVCRSANLLTSIYPESHDIKMNHIITEDMILHLI